MPCLLPWFCFWTDRYVPDMKNLHGLAKSQSGTYEYTYSTIILLWILYVFCVNICVVKFLVLVQPVFVSNNAGLILSSFISTIVSNALRMSSFISTIVSNALRIPLNISTPMLNLTHETASRMLDTSIVVLLWFSDAYIVADRLMIVQLV